MIKQFIKLCALATTALFLFSSVNTAFARETAQGPVEVLQSVADQLIANLKASKASIHSNPTLVFSLAKKIVVPHADVNGMAQRVIPPKVWGNATAAQRTKFQDEFTTVLVRTYASALAEYKDEVVQFYPVRGGINGKSTVQVNSVIKRSDGPSIGVNYSMVLKGAEWKLNDLTVEGVSLLESFRSQFADELSRGDMNNLIQKLGQHNTATSGVH